MPLVTIVEHAHTIAAKNTNIFNFSGLLRHILTKKVTYQRETPSHASQHRVGTTVHKVSCDVPLVHVYGKSNPFIFAWCTSLASSHSCTIAATTTQKAGTRMRPRQAKATGLIAWAQAGLHRAKPLHGLRTRLERKMRQGHSIKYVRSSCSPGRSVCGSRLKASGGPLCGSMHVANDGWS